LLPTGVATTASLASLMPGGPFEGYEQVEDREVPRRADTPASRVSSWTRGWQGLPFGGIRVTAYRYSEDAAASEAQRNSRLELVGDVTETFAVGSLSNARGMRYACDAWTWLQSPGQGYVCDRVD